MGKTSKTTYLLVLILVIAGGYWAYQQYSNNQVEETAGVTVTNENGAPVGEGNQADQFLAILQNIDKVTLQEKSLLSDPLFATKLQDFGKTVEDRPLGRTNPFAALTGGPAVVAKPTTQTTPVTPAPEEETVVPSEEMGE